jgi:hypothetical protein
MQIQAEQGYLVVAQNNQSTDYIRLARSLARSLRWFHPDAKICLLTDKEISTDQDFDFVKIFPYGDQAQDHDWKLINDWQCFAATPFRETIKLEADMVITSPIDHWFSCCRQRPVVLTHGARNYLGQITNCRDYRRVFDVNDLPDVYNAITYWRLSREAQEFFFMVRDILHNWDRVMSLLKYASDQPINTDLAYAIAAKTLGRDQFHLPQDIPSLVHMKPAINGTADDWTKELVWEFEPGSLRINTMQQLWPVHYHVKSWVSEIERVYG